VDDPSSADVAAHGGPTREPPGQPVPDRGRGP
jgi:hypothetical protein